MPTDKRIRLALFLLLTLLLLSNCATAPVSDGEKTAPVVAPAAEKEKAVVKPEEVPDPLVDRYRSKAINYENTGEFLKAAEMWKIVSGLKPTDRAPVEKVEALLKKADVEAAAHFAKGVEHYQKGATAAARKEFLLTLLNNPDNKAALDYLKIKLAGEEGAQYTVQRGDSLQSIAQKFYNDPHKDFILAYFNNLDRQARLAPDTNIMVPALEITEPEKPKEEYESTSVEEEDETPQVKTEIAGFLSKATELLNAKKYREAIAAAENVLKYESRNAAALNIIGVANYELGKNAHKAKNYPEALKYLSKVNPAYRDVKTLIVTTQNLLAEVRYNAGVKFYVGEKIEEAIREWKEALALNPKHPRAARDIENAQKLLQKLQKLK